MLFFRKNLSPTQNLENQAGERGHGGVPMGGRGSRQGRRTRGTRGPGSLFLGLCRGGPKSPWVSPALCQALGQPTMQDRQTSQGHRGVGLVGRCRNNLSLSQRVRKRANKEMGKDPGRREAARGRDGKEEGIKWLIFPPLCLLSNLRGWLSEEQFL